VPFLATVVVWALALSFGLERRGREERQQQQNPVEEYAGSVGEICQLVAEGLGLLVLVSGWCGGLCSHCRASWGRGKVWALFTLLYVGVTLCVAVAQKGGATPNEALWLTHVIMSVVGTLLLPLVSQLIGENPKDIVYGPLSEEPHAEMRTVGSAVE